MKVINEARTDYKYRLSPLHPIITNTIFSNKVSTTIIDAALKIIKTVDKKTACIFDIITYTISISNISKEPINNIYFIDLLPNGLEYINNSLTINSKNIYCINPTDPFFIGSLNTNETIIISFKAVVTCDTSLNLLENSSIVYFDYIYDTSMAPTKISLKSNYVSTFIENILFKQFNINSTLEIPLTKPKIYSISNINFTFNILKLKLISTPITSTIAHPNDDLCTLLIIGSISYEVFYTSLCKSYCYNTKSYTDYLTSNIIINTKGFSSNLLIPYGSIFCNLNNINISLENTSYYLINERKIYINSDILLNIE